MSTMAQTKARHATVTRLHAVTAAATLSPSASAPSEGCKFAVATVVSSVVVSTAVATAAASTTVIIVAGGAGFCVTVVVGVVVGAVIAAAVGGSLVVVGITAASSLKMKAAEAQAANTDHKSPTLGGAPSLARRHVPASAVAADAHVLGWITLPVNTHANSGTSFTFRYRRNAERLAEVVSSATACNAYPRNIHTPSSAPTSHV
mmetsp:Transcript_54455/g.93838  ORF Transcript_54455/g.93838 Transcript_54455/m.93838 type:complete len:204 (-) Transcript_54455:58-669(-)